MMTVEEKNKLKEEINKAIHLIDDESYRYDILNEGNSFERFYNFATEDMRGYYHEFGKPRTFLTVGASGDQILNAVKLGAERIDAFDLNRLSKRQCSQKVSAASVLTPDDLYNYFNTFKEEMFTSFSDRLKEEDRIFWSTLFDFNGESEFSKLYPYKKLSKEMVCRINPYLDEDGYSEFQKRLADVEINYIDSNIYDLERYLGDNTYDGMTFSNIYEYLNYGRNVSHENALRYYEFIMKQMYPRLNDNGTIMVTYMYAFSDKVRDYVKEMVAEGDLDELVYSGRLAIDQLDLYLRGMTSQNYSYVLLLDLFEKENIKKVATTRVEFGQSFDDAHDMALCLKKTK